MPVGSFSPTAKCASHRSRPAAAVTRHNAKYALKRRTASLPVTAQERTDVDISMGYGLEPDLVHT